MGDDAIAPVKWLRKKLSSVAAVCDRRAVGLGPSDGSAEPRRYSLAQSAFEELVIRPLIPELTGGEIAGIVTRGDTIYARIDFSAVQIAALVDSRGCALLDPPEREAIPLVCRACPELQHDLTTVITNSPPMRGANLVS